MLKTSDPEHIRATNRYAVIDVIRRDGPIARVEIAERTQLSPATVSAITGGLIDEGMIEAVRVDAEQNGLGRGRPRVMLKIRGDAHHVAGVKLSAHRISIAVTDAKGELLKSLILPVRISRQAPPVIADLVEDGVRQCVADAGLAMADIDGVGVGLPGVIDGVAGVSLWSPILGDAPVPFAEEVARRLGTGTCIENDANLVTLAEHWFGEGRGLSSFVVITIENTVGMGVLIDGRLYRGAHGTGPEFGHVKLGLGRDDPLPPCRCGQRGCLDAAASDAGILNAARAAGLIEAGDPGAADGRASDHQLIVGVTERALAGDAALAALFRRAGAVLGLGIANLVSMLNPPRIIVAGEGLRAGAMIREPLLAALDANVLPKLRAATEVVFHSWGDEMWARGAASLVLRRLYEASLTPSPRQRPGPGRPLQEQE